MAIAELKAPRLQMRWEANPDMASRHEWLCHYELVLPLRKTDIRREIYADDADGEQVGERSELVVAIKEPTLRSGNHVPCMSLSGEGPFFDSPYRDGAHAKWDAEVLGGLPIYVIALDGTPLTEPTP